MPDTTQTEKEHTPRKKVVIPRNLLMDMEKMMEGDRADGNKDWIPFRELVEAGEFTKAVEAYVYPSIYMRCLRTAGTSRSRSSWAVHAVEEIKASLAIRVEQAKDDILSDRPIVLSRNRVAEYRDPVYFPDSFNGFMNEYIHRPEVHKKLKEASDARGKNGPLVDELWKGATEYLGGDSEDKDKARVKKIMEKRNDDFRNTLRTRIDKIVTGVRKGREVRFDCPKGFERSAQEEADRKANEEADRKAREEARAEAARRMEAEKTGKPTQMKMDLTTPMEHDTGKVAPEKPEPEFYIMVTVTKFEVMGGKVIGTWQLMDADADPMLVVDAVSKVFNKAKMA